MIISIIGSRTRDKSLGKLASAIKRYSEGHSTKNVYFHDIPHKDSDVVIYTRSTDGSLPRVVDYCALHQTPLLLLSTGLSTGQYTSAEFPFFLLPNSSRDVNEYINKVIKYANSHSLEKIHITEHHQPSKKDVSGTALHILDQIENESLITSVRNKPQTNTEFPQVSSSLSAYAVHDITFTNQENEETKNLQLIVTDHETYAKGALEAAEWIHKNRDHIENGIQNFSFPILS